MGRSCVAAALVLAGASGVMQAGEKQPGAAMKLSLEKLGFPGVSNTFLDVGSSMLTVNFLDDTHLLVTYSLRDLVPRLVGDPQDDDDRQVAAEVVELPGGKVLARTVWHMHDHARYLWPLRQGRFLLRIGEQLYTITPLAKLMDASAAGAQDPFQRTVFLGRHARPVVVEVSEDGKLLTVESELDLGKPGRELDVTSSVAERPRTMTVLDFFRLQGDGSAGSPLVVTTVGGVKSTAPFFLTMNASGYVWPVVSGNNKFAVTFDDFGGKTRLIGTLDSSCAPRIELLSASEYLAMTCRGASDRVRMASYGFDGVETWQEDMGDFGPPRFAFAPEAARFAVSRTVEGTMAVAASMTSNGAAATVARQEVRVYQNASGDLLLKVDVTPAFKTAENFDLSADGSELVVVKDESILVYKLPGLSKRDKEDMAEVAKFAPPAGKDGAAVRLGLLVTPTAAAAAPAEVGEMLPAGAKAGGAAAAAQQAAGTESVPVPRKAPTLLNPGEKAEFGGGAQPE